MTRKLSSDNANRYSVHGTVTDFLNDPLRHAEVIVWWQRIRERTRLNVGHTAKDGTYHIEYQIPENAPENILIVVEARSRHLKHPIIHSAVVAQPDLTIDLAALSRDTSEWSGLLRVVRPLLDGLDFDDLVENTQFHDISFLAQETGKSKEQITRLTLAARLGEAYSILEII